MNSPSTVHPGLRDFMGRRGLPPESLRGNGRLALVIDGRVLGKPSCHEEAVSMIELLQGRTHTVMTGVAVLAPDGRKLLSCENDR